MCEPNSWDLIKHAADCSLLAICLTAIFAAGCLGCYCVAYFYVTLRNKIHYARTAQSQRQREGR